MQQNTSIVRWVFIAATAIVVGLILWKSSASWEMGWPGQTRRTKGQHKKPKTRQASLPH